MQKLILGDGRMLPMHVLKHNMDVTLLTEWETVGKMMMQVRDDTPFTVAGVTNHALVFGI